MEELTGLQQGYYHLQKSAYAEAQKIFRQVLEENDREAPAYIGILLAENGLQDDRQLGDLPLPLADYELFARAKECASEGYRETLASYERQQEKKLRDKEIRYTELVDGAAKENKSEETLKTLVGSALLLKNYKDAPILRERLEKELQELRDAKKKKKKKVLTVCLCIAIPLLIALTVFGVLFAMPSEGGVRYALTLNGFSAIGSEDSVRTVEIPEKIHGIAVTSIGNKAFKNRDHLKEVTLNGKIDSIGKSAFSNCRNLEKVNGAENVKEVGEKAFKDCAELTELHFAEGCAFSKDAFKDCSESLAVYAGGQRAAIEISDDAED